MRRVLMLFIRTLVKDTYGEYNNFPMYFLNSAMFINRRAELTFLQNVLTRKRPGPGQLILLYGRRRVGKPTIPYNPTTR